MRLLYVRMYVCYVGMYVAKPKPKPSVLYVLFSAIQYLVICRERKVTWHAYLTHWHGMPHPISSRIHPSIASYHMETRGHHVVVWIIKKKKEISWLCWMCAAFVMQDGDV